MRDNNFNAAQTLLDWYDINAREMPWRVSPQDRNKGALCNPYHVWMSEIMLQQTTVAAVKDYFLKFTKAWPTVFELAAAKDADVMAAWAGLGYYARARNLLKCARIVATELGGVFPDNETDLQKLPGIGPYTSAAIVSIAFDKRATVLDGNVERVMARFHKIIEPLPASKETLRGLATQALPEKRYGDYSQAVMDLGATICTPKSPSCSVCPWVENCKAFAENCAAELPKKLPKPVKPVRYGTCFVGIFEDGSVVLERRPDKGLLGGMLGWPGDVWAETVPMPVAPYAADWIALNGYAKHTFTHFHLELSVRVARLKDKDADLGLHLHRERNFDPNDLPTVMRKVWGLVDAA